MRKNMNGMIDAEGQFHLKRAGIMTPQTCRISRVVLGSVEAYGECNDTCPMFGEPIQEAKYLPIILDLCQVSFQFEWDEFEDQREVAK